MICMFRRQPHLANFSGDKKAWRDIYMTIGNLSATTRMKHTMHSVLLVMPFAHCRQDARCNHYERSLMLSEGSITEMIYSECTAACLCNPSFNSETSIFYARFVLMATSGIVIRHWLHGWQIIPSGCNARNIENGVCYWCECPKQEMGNLLHANTSNLQPVGS